MSKQENQAPALDIQDRMARLIEAEQRSLKKPVSGKDLQALEAVTARLDQLLARAAEAELQDLHCAASRLDQLLKEISEGKAVHTRLRRRVRTPRSPGDV